MLAIIIVGMLLHINGQATIGEMVTFMNFAGVINSRLEQSVTFINRLMMEAPRLHEFSGMGHGAGHSRRAECGRSWPPRRARRVQGCFVLILRGANGCGGHHRPYRDRPELPRIRARRARPRKAGWSRLGTGLCL